MVVPVILIFISCKKEYSCANCGSNPPTGSTNKSPIANPGPDQTIILPTDSVKLDGSLSSDPDGTISSFQWTKISGPASFTISAASAAITSAKQLVMGVYQFELKVADNGGLFAKDTVQITVNDLGQPNRPPVAKAGADQTITSPINSITMDGSSSTDPDNNITSYLWAKISGPPQFNITPLNTVQTQVVNLAEGVYQFELKVTDAGGLFSKDTIQITVNAASIACDNSTRSQVNAQLITVGTLSKARGGMAVASAGSKIVFAGGAGTIDCPECWGSSRVDIYDIVTQIWSTAELSVGRWGISAVAAGNKIFFAGGEWGDGAFDSYYSTVDIYDVSTNTWSVASLSQPRSKIAAAAAGNKVFFAGGEKAMDYSTSAVVDIYDISANSWSTSLLSEPRSYISAVTTNNKIYFAGGHNEDRWYQSPSNKIDIYNNTTGTWTISSLLVHSGYMSSIAVNDKIYWAGGCPVEIRNVNTGNSSVAYLSKRGGYHSVVKDGKIVFIEGGDKFDIYDIATNVWSVGGLPVNLSVSAIISVNNIIYVTNGNQVWKLEF